MTERGRHCRLAHADKSMHAGERKVNESEWKHKKSLKKEKKRVRGKESDAMGGDIYISV